MNDRAYVPWSSGEERNLVQMYRRGASVCELSCTFGRSQSAILARLQKNALAFFNTDPNIKATPSKSPDGEYFGVQTVRKEINGDSVIGRLFCVYVIVNSEGLVYVGYSNDVSKRIRQHNLGRGAVATKGNGPWRLGAILCFRSEGDARTMETLIRGNFPSYVRYFEMSIRDTIQDLGVLEQPKRFVLV